MGKKAREYKSGDFIFAKVKGYPAWPARIQKPNGKKYFVYFYGTGETANLPPNMIFDYVENKDKFLTKSVKRRDFNDGVKQIEHDFANNVPLERVIGFNPEIIDAEAANDTADETINETANDTINTTVDTTAVADETANADTTASQNDTAAVEDSDEAGNLVIDEGKKTKKIVPKTPSTKDQTPKTPKGGRGRPRKEEKDKVEDEEDAKKEELVSRSGRKIRPKRYIDEQTEENATLPSPAPKRKRGSPAPEAKDKPVDKPVDKTADKAVEKPAEKTVKQFNAVSQSELEDLKEPFKPADAEKENILIAYLPTGQYVGIKVFESRPSSFKNDQARLQWDKQAASNALTLKMQLERGQITPQSISAQLVMDLNLTDEEKATLDKEKETEEKKSRVQLLKTEMKLIELDAKIKTCLCLEKADTELCLKLLDELTELEIKPLMLFKHPTCLETVKRLRAYVGNTPSWDLSEKDALAFSKQAHRIRRHADKLYNKLRGLFDTPEGLSFWEYFSERVLQFKKVTAKLNADELLEMVHEPPEMSTPSTTSLKAAIDAANAEEPTVDENKKDDENAQKKKTAPAKPKKVIATPAKTPAKRQSSRNKGQDEKEKKKDEVQPSKNDSKKNGEETAKNTNQTNENLDEPDSGKTADKVSEENNKPDEPSSNSEEANKNNSEENKNSEVPMEVDSEKTDKPENVANSKDTEHNSKSDVVVAIEEPEAEKATETSEKVESSEKSDKNAKSDKSDEKAEKTKDKNDKPKDKLEKSREKSDKNKDKHDKQGKEKSSKSSRSDHKSDNNKEKSEHSKETSEKSDHSKDKSETSKEKSSESTKDKSEKDKSHSSKEKTDSSKDKAENSKDSNSKSSKEKVVNSKEKADSSKSENKVDNKVENSSKDDVGDTNAKGDNKSEKEDKSDKESEKDKEKEADEPRAKRSRGENKKTEAPPPRSPAKRKAKS